MKLCLLLALILYSTSKNPKAIKKKSKSRGKRLPKLEKPEQLEKLKRESGLVFVFYYDPYSPESLKAMKHLLKIRNNKFFSKSKARLFCVNVIKSQKAFSKYIGKNKVELILYRKKKRALVFDGILNYFGLLHFVKGQVQGGSMVRLGSLAEYSSALKSHDFFFLFTGSKTSARYTLVLEATRKFPKTLTFKITKPAVLDSLGLKRGALYFAKASAKRAKKFEKNFTAPKLKRWVAMQVLRRYTRLRSRSYDLLKKKGQTLAVLIVKSGKKYSRVLEKYLQFAEKTKSKARFRVCDLRKDDCKRFLYRVGRNKLEGRRLPAVFMIQPSKQSADDHIFFYRPSKRERVRKILAKLNLRKFRRFFRGVMRRKTLPREFSEEIHAYLSPDRFQKVVHKTLDHFLVEEPEKDHVLLFFDSRKCMQSCREKSATPWLCNSRKDFANPSRACENMVAKFEEYVRAIRSQWDGHEGMVRYGHYDLGKNTFDMLAVQDTGPFVRMYKANRLHEISDWRIPGMHSDLIHEFTDFMLTNTQHLFDDQETQFEVNSLEVDRLGEADTDL